LVTPSTWHLRRVNLIERQRDQSENEAVSSAGPRQRSVPACSSSPPLSRHPPSRRGTRPRSPPVVQKHVRSAIRSRRLPSDADASVCRIDAAVDPGLRVRTPGSARPARRRATRRGRRHEPRLDARVWRQAGSAGGRTSVARGGAAAIGAGRARASDRRCAGPRGRRATSARCEGRRPAGTAPVMQRLRRWVGLVPAPLASAFDPLSPSASLQHPRGSDGPYVGPVLQAR
jgi:hypothetical protein